MSTVQYFLVSKVPTDGKNLRLDALTDPANPRIPHFSPRAYELLGEVRPDSLDTITKVKASAKMVQGNLKEIDKKEVKLLKEKKLAPLHKALSITGIAVLITAAIITAVALAVLIWPTTGSMGLLLVSPIFALIAGCLGYCVSKCVKAFKEAPKLEKALNELKENAGLEAYETETRAFLDSDYQKLEKVLRKKIDEQGKKAKKGAAEEKQKNRDIKKEYQDTLKELKYLREFYTAKTLD